MISQPTHAMKPNRRLPILFTLLLAALAMPVQAQVEGPPKRIDYQGQVLDSAGLPLAPSTPTNYTMEFRLYAAQSGGASIWSESQTVTVSNGAFSARLGEGIAIGAELHGDLAAAFNGKDRYLGLTVIIPGQTPGEVTPRLAFLTSPFSFVAERAKTADSVSQATGNSTLGTTTIVNLTVAGPAKVTAANTLEFGAGVGGKSADAGKIGYGTFTAGTLDIVGAGSLANGLDRKIKLFAEGGLTVSGPLSLSGNQTIAAPSSLSFGSTTRQMLNLWGTTFGLGVQNATLYSRADTNFAWFAGGVHNDSQNNPGTGGTLLATLSGSGFSLNVGQLSVDTPNFVAEVVSSPSATGTWSALRNTSVGGTTWQWISSGSGNGEGAGKLLLGAGSGPGTIVGSIMTVQSNGRVGIGSSSPNSALDVRGDIKLGPTGQYSATSGEETLRIVRGAGTANVAVNGASLLPIHGAGFTYKKIAQGVVEVTFNSGFAGTPTVTANAIAVGSIFCGLEGLGGGGNPGSSGFRIIMWDTGGNGRDWPFNFIAVGPR